MLKIGFALIAAAFVASNAQANEVVRKCGKLRGYVASPDGRSVLIRLDSDLSPSGGPTENSARLEGKALEDLKALMRRPESNLFILCATGARDVNNVIVATGIRQSAGGNF